MSVQGVRLQHDMVKRARLALLVHHVHGSILLDAEERIGLAAGIVSGHGSRSRRA